jgi:hypothetical protein
MVCFHHKLINLMILSKIKLCSDMEVGSLSVIRCKRGNDPTKLDHLEAVCLHYRQQKGA